MVQENKTADQTSTTSPRPKRKMARRRQQTLQQVVADYKASVAGQSQSGDVVEESHEELQERVEDSLQNAKNSVGKLNDQVENWFVNTFPPKSKPQKLSGSVNSLELAKKVISELEGRVETLRKVALFEPGQVPGEIDVNPVLAYQGMFYLLWACFADLTGPAKRAAYTTLHVIKQQLEAVFMELIPVPVPITLIPMSLPHGSLFAFMDGKCLPFYTADIRNLMEEHTETMIAMAKATGINDVYFLRHEWFSEPRAATVRIVEATKGPEVMVPVYKQEDGSWADPAESKPCQHYDHSAGKVRPLRKAELEIRSSAAQQRMRLALDTANAYKAWDDTLDMQAMACLHELLDEEQSKSFEFTGEFMYTSKRSGVQYQFRKLKPTLAFRVTPARAIVNDFDKWVMAGAPTTERELWHAQYRLLSALCLHTGGFYFLTHAGILPPHADLFAQFSLLRADEHRFWAKAQQHALEDPASGI